jgi:tetratricopeptide (TPR) repeat protein
MTVRQPFIGERAYRAADAHLFFGRTAPALEARSLWLSKRLTVIHGPEAAGKTSVLLAGILPHVGPVGAADVLPAGRITASPVPGRGQPAADRVDTLLRSWKGTGQPPAPGMTIRDFLEERRAKLKKLDESRLLLAAIDQFEDIFAGPPGRSGQERLLDELATALNVIPSFHLLLVVRQDFLALLKEHERFRELRPHYLSLRPFDAGTAAEVLGKAASVSGVSFASGVADQLVRDLQTVTFADAAGNAATVYRNEIEPLHLQIAGRSLWASLPAKADTITGEQLQAWGGVDAALIHFYDSAVKEIAAEFSAGEGHLRGWIQRTFVTELGTRDSAQESHVAMAPIPGAIVNSLVARHILSAEYREGALWYQLSHDRLAYAVLAANRDWENAHGYGPEDEGMSRAAGSAHDLAEAAFREGDLIAAKRNAAEAADNYQAAGDWRGMADARVLQADIARASGDLISAERYFRAAFSIFIILEDAYSAARMLSALGELHFIAGDYVEAADTYRQAVERMPGDVTALTGLAYAQWLAGSPADAEATFDQVLRWDSETPMALAGRGQVRADLARYGNALDDLDRALQFPLNRDVEADARSARALALAGLGRVVEARKELAVTLQLEPDRPRSRLRAARVAAILGHREEMRAEIERALNGRPSLSSVERDSANRLLNSFR